MITATCLALIVYFEARGEPELAQRYVADVAIFRAKIEGVTVCESMRKPKAYSWVWDRKSDIIDPPQMKIVRSIAEQELKSQKIQGRKHFNEKRLGKIWNTQVKPVTVGNLIFY